MISHEQASEIDGKLADLWARQNAARKVIADSKLSLARAAGFRPYYQRKVLVVSETLEEILAAATAKAATEPDSTYSEINFAPCRYHLAKRAAAVAELAAAEDEAAPLEAIYAEHRWSRFFLVVSSAGGHIHSSMSCSTCRFDTGFSWLPDLSGLTEADAVAAHGPHLCTVCYPSAPVEWTMGTPKEQKDECPGSRTFDQEPGSWRQTSYTGTGHCRCSHCGERVGTSKTGKIRAHKPAKVAA